MASIGYDAAAGAGRPLDGPDGIAAVVRCALGRPARLGGTRLVAVDGPSGSGKTSLAEALAQAIAGAIRGVVVRPERSTDARTTAAEDDSLDVASYPVRARDERPLVTVVSTDLLATWRHPLDWWPTLESHLLAPLAAGLTATMPVLEWVSGNPRPGGSIVVPPVDVLVLEGVSSGRRAIAGRLSALAWVEITDRAARLERAVARDGEPMRPFLTRWQLDEDAHFAADGTRARADVVIVPD